VIVTKKQVETIVFDLFQDALENVIHELDPEKYYIVIVPEDIPEERVRRVFRPFENGVNLVVLQGKVRIVELG
jgi:hypothetical protein